jgi:hypothetical protein
MLYPFIYSLSTFGSASDSLYLGKTTKFPKLNEKGAWSKCCLGVNEPCYNDHFDTFAKIVYEFVIVLHYKKVVSVAVWPE